MKSELFTAIGVAIAGVVISIVVTNLVTDSLYPIAPVDVKSIDGTVNTDLVNPNPLVFNYRAINPTVEVYVGQDGNSTPNCTFVDDAGNCINADSNNQENQ